MKNREYYQNTFDEVHVPVAVLRKVKGMKMEEKKIQKRSKLRYAIAAAAVLGISVVASNGICYAATGDTWVSKIVMYINGEPVEQEMVWHQEGDMVYGDVVVETDGAEEIVVALEGVDSAPDTFYMDVQNDPAFDGKLVREEEKLFLVLGDAKIDITEDFADGDCGGVFDYEGVTYAYEVTGDEQEYNIVLNGVK